MKKFELYHSDCLAHMKTMPDNSVDSIVTDPPYELGFMGKKWDSTGIAYSVEMWAECLRILKPGGHLLAFSATRTVHRMVCSIEDAGFEIRDMIGWLYGSGMPKSLNVSKAMAKRAGGEIIAKKAISFMKARREELGLSRIEFEKLIFGRSDGNVRNWEDGISLPKPGLWAKIKNAMNLESTPFDSDMERGDIDIGTEEGSYGYQSNGDRWENDRVIREPNTELAKQWDGWGTALKPSFEPITVARKPLIGTVVANVLEYGTGAINIDGCRVGANGGAKWVPQGDKCDIGQFGGGIKDGGIEIVPGLGRWPANICHDGSDEVLSLFPITTSGGGDKHGRKSSTFCASTDWNAFKGTSNGGDTGSAARFFYCAKASRTDRNYGLYESSNVHPTVKPNDLMRYLSRLVTPPGGTIFSPFCGSGSGGVAAIQEGFYFIGTEMTKEYYDISMQRLNHAVSEIKPKLP